MHGDFSLNVTNSVTARHLLALGCDTLTAAHDLDETQLHAMLASLPAERITVAVHHHIATFHTEHCVYAHTISQGRDFRTCGRPCEQQQISLQDREGRRHPVVVDIGCRNTVFNAQAQSAAQAVPRLLRAGVKRFRVEFVWEDQATTSSVLAAWADVLAGRASPAELNQRLAAHEQFGVTAGTMRTLVPVSLQPLRAQLDELDAELIRLLARRAGLVQEIWAWKQAHGVPRLDPAREAELRARLLAQAESLGLSRDAVSAILERIIGVPLR